MPQEAPITAPRIAFSTELALPQHLAVLGTWIREINEKQEGT